MRFSSFSLILSGCSNEFLQLAAVLADLMFEEPMAANAAALSGRRSSGGGAVGSVVESGSGLPVGTAVQRMSGWREESVGDPSLFRPVPTGVFPGIEYVLNQGVTAYHGMADVAAVQGGDAVFVSGDAGGVAP